MACWRGRGEGPRSFTSAQARGGRGRCVFRQASHHAQLQRAIAAIAPPSDAPGDREYLWRAQEARA